MTKVDRRIVKWVIFWICLSLLFIFFSNIFMHLFSYQSGNADHNVFKLQGYKYCEIAEDGQYVHTDYAPIQLNYSIDDLPEEISQICIDFGKPVGNFVWLDVYYPDEQGNYPEESVVKERLVPGLEEHVIDVEPGKYHEIRIDFDQSIYIKDVHAGGYEKKCYMQIKRGAIVYGGFVFCFLSFCLHFYIALRHVELCGRNCAKV